MGRKEAATTRKGTSDGALRTAFHEAAHAVVAVLLGLRARAELHGAPGHGTTDIDAPGGTAGADLLLVALVAGTECEGRLLGSPRDWRASTEDARAILSVAGGLTDESLERLAAAKAHAARIVRDPRVWSAIAEIAARLERSSVAEDPAIREALRRAGLEPGTAWPVTLGTS